jgi:hypothetical protein
MKATIIPAQSTTIEDKLAGNLSFIQLILLLIPVLLSTLIYLVLPQIKTISLYKALLMIINFCLFGTLAIRIKGKVLLEWVVIIAKFNLRPKFYVCDKNSSYQREIIEVEIVKKDQKNLQTSNLGNNNFNLATFLNRQQKFSKPGQSKIVTFNKKGGQVFVAVN